MKGLAFFTGFVALACAQHLGVQIPQVEKIVEESLQKFDKYVNYQAPPNAPAKPTGKPKTTNGPAASCDYWLDEIPHNGVAAFNSNSSYQVYRNVMDFGATGNGETDDTAAINAAISSGNRCAPGSCQGSTTTPAVVYFPPGTYLISSSIIDYYMTQLIGNPNCLPTILAAPNFSGGLGLIDADPYQSSGNQGYGSTNIFWRQIRNFIIDTTQVAASSSITGIHWPTAQATSVENVIFNLNSASGTQHQGMFIENGSAGVLEDLIFNGGLYGINVGNQQFTMRNLTFNGNTHAVNMLWDWGFTWQGISVNNVQSGIIINNVGGTGNNVTEVGSIAVIDSSFTNCPTAIVANRNSNVNPHGANQVILENVALNNVPVVVSNAGSTSLAGSSGASTITAWGQGISYTPSSGPTSFQENIPSSGNAGGRPANLLSGGKYLTMPKPQYSGYTTSQVVTVRSHGATGNGQTDDTTAFQNAINAAVSSKSLLFVDQGDYLVSKTLSFPPGLMITGESYPVILSSGSFFNNMNSPQPVVQIGTSGQTGSIQWSNMIVSTQGQQEGAILIEYNLNSGSSTPSGIWDVHTRIGGFTGSNLQVSQCPTTPGTTVTSSNLVTSCIAAYMSMYVTSGSSGLYMANNWLWNADHDVDSADQTQITVYSGRGLLIESQGPVWLVGTAVEHHVKYQYQFVNAKDVYAGYIQTETPYYQPNPGASIPFPTVSSLSDPVFASSSASGASTVDAWGLRLVNSTSVLIYGAGHYSFFDNYSTTCSDQGTDDCQANIVNFAGTNNDITIYNLNTVGVPTAINYNGKGIGAIANEEDGFEDTIGWFSTNT